MMELMQKGFVPAYFLIGILVILAIAGGAYYFGKSSVKPISEPRISMAPIATPTFTPTSVSSDNTDWKAINSVKCGINIKYPQGWTAKEIEAMGNIPNYNEGCLILNSPDFKIFPQSDVFEGTTIIIQRMLIGTIFKSPVKDISTTINTPDDYIKAENSSVAMSNESGAVDYISNVQDKSLGDLKGKLYVSSAAATDYNFIFTGGNYIYRIIWSKTYSGQYKGQLESIVSTVQLLK